MIREFDMAIGGVETQSTAQLSTLRNTQTARTEDTRAQQEVQDARFISSGATETESVAARSGVNEDVADRFGFGTPATTLDSQSLSTLIQATQEQNDSQAQDDSDAESLAADETRQQQAVAGNSTNSLAPGTTAGLANGSTDTRGVSLLV